MAGHLVTERTRPQRELRRADALRLDLGREPEGRVEENVEISFEAFRPLRPPVAPNAVDVAADCEEAIVRAKRLHPIARGIDPVAADEARRPACEHPRSLDDLRARHAGLPLGPFGCARADALREGIEAVTPVRHVVAVVEALVNEHLRHRKRDRAIGAWPWPQPKICHLGRRGLERVDHD